jgi:hypothetical protein
MKGKLSIIKDTETINECDTVQEENVNSDSEDGLKPLPSAVDND